MSESEAEEFTSMPDLASRALGGSVSYANDEFFAEKENLIKSGPPEFAPDAFGHKGKVYDGWETRRRRDAGHDYAIVRLGCPGVVHGVVVDTAFFRGNYPPEVSVEAACADGYPDQEELAGHELYPLVARTAAVGDAVNRYAVADPRRWTHVRLSIYPDGGVARFRVHGEVVPDPAFTTGTVDLVALENGGRVTGCSNAFYSSPANLIMPGRPRAMSDGWENARRRGPGNDWVEFQLAAPGRLRRAEIDTSYFVGNAPGWVTLSVAGPSAPEQAAQGEAGGSAQGQTGGGGRSAVASSEPAWRQVLPRTRVLPDTLHRFVLDDEGEVSRVRLDVYPDGGLARLRLYGELTPGGLAALERRWRETAPSEIEHQRAVDIG
jgi:allantoicase